MNWLLMTRKDRQNRMETVKIRRRSLLGWLWNLWRSR